jgi:hypothetical protein
LEMKIVTQNIQKHEGGSLISKRTAFQRVLPRFHMTDPLEKEASMSTRKSSDSAKVR